jgi:hypothetical protein
MNALRRLLVPTPARLREEVLAGAPWVVGFTLLTALLELFGWLAPFSNMGEDTFGVLRAERPPQDVVVVTIDRASFEARDLFKSGEPLPVDSLHRLLAAVAAAKPRLIAVDLATSDASFKALRLDPGWPPIVWGQQAVPALQGCITVPDCAYRAIPVLGGSLPRIDDDAACRSGRGCAAIPIRLPDGDLMGRRYTHEIEVKGLEDRPTFPWAVVETCASLEPPDARCSAALARSPKGVGEETIQFDIADPWPALRTASTAIRLNESSDPALRDAWRNDPALRGHIVIIGGTYDTLDVHHIPGGVRAGVFINAQIVENELGDRAIREVPFVALLTLDLVVGFSLVYLAYRLPFGPALGAAAALIGCIFLMSFTAFRTFSIWLNFVPVVVGVGLHEFTDNVREYARLRRAEHPAEAAAQTAQTAQTAEAAPAEPAELEPIVPAAKAPAAELPAPSVVESTSVLEKLPDTSPPKESGVP